MGSNGAGDPLPYLLYRNGKRMLTFDEGCSLRPYRDSQGHLTIGIGHNLDAGGLPAKLIDDLFIDDLIKHLASARRIFPEFNEWEHARQLAVLNMVFNLGESGVLDFRHMVLAIRQQDWDAAAVEAADSLWAKQVGRRADRVVRMLRDGVFPKEYGIEI